MSNNYQPLSAMKFKKSNDMISAKYKSSLLENQIMAVSLTRIESIFDKNGDERMEAKFYPSELAEIIGNKENIYRDLKKISKTLVGHSIFIEDGKGNFRAHSLIPDATYENGIFTIKFNPSLKEHIFKLERNYTTFDLATLIEFKRSSSFRLYELLMKDAYRLNNNSEVILEYNLAELKFMIGLVDIDNPVVKNKMSSMGSDVDWDILYDCLSEKDQKYAKWYDFQNYVIKPAQQEIKDNSFISFDYEGLRVGRKISKVRFVLRMNDDPKNKDQINKKANLIKKDRADLKTVEFEQTEYPRIYHEEFYNTYIGHNNMSEEDIDALMIKANWNENIVEKAITAADKQEHVDSYVGWIYRYIERGGFEQIEVIKGSAEDAKRAKAVLDDYNEHRDDIAFKMIKKARENEPDFFEGFINTLPIPDFDLAIDALGADELCQRYILFKKSNK